jgi:hypothetical protein
MLFERSSISCFRSKKLLSKLGFLPTAGFKTGAGLLGCGLNNSFGDCGNELEGEVAVDFFDIGLEGIGSRTSSSDLMRVAE